MIHSLNLYFQTFLKPTQRSVDGERISYFEVMGISWSLHMIYAFYSIFALYLGIRSYEYLSNSADFSHLLFESINVTFQKISLMMTLFEVIFYPFIFQFGFKFWAYVLRFYAQIFEYDGERSLDIEIEELLNSIFTANIFLIIPIFGNVLSILTMGYYLFSGLRAKLGFTRVQAFLVLLTPLFLMFLTTILVASYFTFLISLI
ncbi:hypothetical protein DOM21_15295 [Bacteriovorax stolpii]|uniref:Uncharacterized protein n=1 Tax=Bacteriovorax stolpii TaxID=960 RepID=A0A2K9NP49_BACTC|nr:hypothetical protein [Bacteriovorax stolpii]AUN97272.1 hypothetical protein C0V70_03930 [Bacteriovorax stolpii]QDK42790.1 hypothetical protein DOM21_15295 [Bacteriovorax stolpii]TDP52442.1 hypothetical protein C8D79_2206 [Bacteriovorax stolpii]